MAPRGTAAKTGTEISFSSEDDSLSDSDSFIEEVSEELRRDQLYKTMRRYGWIAVLAVLLLVGATSFLEWRKSQAKAEAEALGDTILAALSLEESSERAEALGSINAPEGSARAVVTLLAAGETYDSEPAQAATRLLSMADDPTIPQAYRQIAVLKAVSIRESGLSVDDRRGRLNGLVPGGGIVRLLAQEQLALILLEEGASDAALQAFDDIAADAEATPSLRQRATQMITALGGTPSFTPQDEVEPAAQTDAN
ncbi:MAG: hypothetical protein AAFQ38_16160 [Pseudomonadota bacterium]